MKIKEGILLKVDNKDFVNGTLTIPEGVKQISDDFSQNSKNLIDLEKVVFPKMFTSIGKRAFSGCKRLKEVVFGDRIISIKEEAFKGCGIEILNLPEDIEIIKDNAFADCKQLKKVIFPKSSYTLGMSVFSGCNSLTGDLELGKVENIGSSAFKNCVNIKSVTINSDKLKAIGSNAFNCCRSLKTVKLPDSLSSIGSSTFIGCEKLESINLPEKLTTIPDCLFMNCHKLKEIKIPDRVMTIYASAFYKCHNLRKVTLPKELHAIGSMAFLECYKLKNIELPEGLVHISDKAFADCWNLKSVSFPTTLEIINFGAFDRCFKLKEVDLYNTQVDKCAFQDCLSLTDFTLREGSVETTTFTKCKNIKNIRIGEKVKFLEIPFSSSKRLKKIYKEGNLFVISNNIKNMDAIDIEKLNDAYISALTTVWDKRKNFMADIKNDNLLRLYNLIYKELESEDFAEFFNAKNVKFFKQLPNLPKEDEDFNAFCRFYYNLGGFLAPVEETHTSKAGKEITEKVDYAQIVGEFLKEQLEQEKNIFIQSNDLFLEMKFGRFKRDFTKFITKKENFEKLCTQLHRDKMFIQNCYLQYENVQRTNTSHKGEQRQLKITAEKFIDYFTKDKYKGVTPENYDIASTISPYFNKQESFDSALEIRQEKEENNTSDHILGEPLSEVDVFGQIEELSKMIKTKGESTVKIMNDIAQDNFTFEWLAKNDPKNYILGKFCHCCAHLESAGYTFMRASIVHPDVQNLVIKNDENDIIAKATLYVNRKQGYGLFNNIEINKYMLGEDRKLIFRKFQLAAASFIKKYNSLNPECPIKKINVGMGHNDAREIIEKKLEREKTLLESIKYEEYGSIDKRGMSESDEEQYIVWKDLT